MADHERTANPETDKDRTVRIGSVVKQTQLKDDKGELGRLGVVNQIDHPTESMEHGGINVIDVVEDPENPGQFKLFGGGFLSAGGSRAEFMAKTEHPDLDLDQLVALSLETMNAVGDANMANTLRTHYQDQLAKGPLELPN